MSLESIKLITKLSIRDNILVMTKMNQLRVKILLCLLCSQLLHFILYMIVDGSNPLIALYFIGVVFIVALIGENIKVRKDLLLVNHQKLYLSSYAKGYLIGLLIAIFIFSAQLGMHYLLDSHFNKNSFKLTMVFFNLFGVLGGLGTARTTYS